MKEKQLEFNLKGISNQKELDDYHKKEMDEISDDATDKLKKVLNSIIQKKKYNTKDIKEIISLGNWIKRR